MPDAGSEWHHEVLPAGWADAASGLALTLGHRRSVDLDLFTDREFDPADIRAHLIGLTGVRVRQAARGTLHLELRDILVSFLRYPYPLLFPLHAFGALAVADPRDIACMKLEAIANRGARRDFVDLYAAAAQYGLDQIFAWFDRKYMAAPYNRVHLLKALTYFADAEGEPMPHLLVPLGWETITRFFLTEVPRLQPLL